MLKIPMCMQSQRDGYRSRASYKLLEIIRQGAFDPPRHDGRRFRVSTRWLVAGGDGAGRPRGRVHAVDLLPMDGIAGVDFIQGDFTEEPVFEELYALIEIDL